MSSCNHDCPTCNGFNCDWCDKPIEVDADVQDKSGLHYHPACLGEYKAWDEVDAVLRKGLAHAKRAKEVAQADGTSQADVWEGAEMAYDHARKVLRKLVP
jgi:hypothetical protein